MSTTLENAQIELSKQLGDFWNSTTTSSGSTTTLIDTGLRAFNDGWIDSQSTQMWDRITSGTYDEEERRITSLVNTTGTLNTLAHGGTIASAVTYEVHRLFSASEKRRALIYASRNAYPFLNKLIDDETKVTGNWLINGSFEDYTSTVANNWTTDTLTAAKNTTKPLYKHGSASYKLSTAAGNIYQSSTETRDLVHLAGKNVTFTVQGWCDTASCLRLQIYDGTTTTSSSYHAGNSAWTKDNEPLKVQATIADNPTEVTFRIVLADAGGTAYVDDARVISETYTETYIGDLGLANNEPREVSVAYDYYFGKYRRLRGWRVDSDNFLVDIPCYSDQMLRITGIGYLDFLVSGAASELWTATINIDKPQLDILVAEAAKYLYGQKVMPNEESGESDQYSRGYSFWDRELAKRKGMFGMKVPEATTQWGN